MAALYEIDSQILHIMQNCVNPETGEITEEASEKLAELNLAYQEKLKNCLLFYKSQIAFAKSCKDAKDEMAKKEAMAKRKAEWMKAYVMEHLPEDSSINTPEVSARWRKGSMRAVVDDLDKLPAGYKKTLVKPDLERIKKCLKMGLPVPGAELKQGDPTIVIK